MAAGGLGSIQHSVVGSYRHDLSRASAGRWLGRGLIHPYTPVKVSRSRSQGIATEVPHLDCYPAVTRGRASPGHTGGSDRTSVVGLH